MFSLLDWMLGVDRSTPAQVKEPESVEPDYEIYDRLLALEMDNDRLRQRLHNLEQELITLRRNLAL